jgi:hypothetical protein
VSGDSESQPRCFVIGRILETRARVEGVEGRKMSRYDGEAASDIMINNINEASSFIFISIK